MDNEQKEVVFTDGLIFKKPREGAPDFVKGAMSFKVDEFKAFLDKHNNNGWVNVDLKVSKGGKLYTQLNDWKPKQEEGGREVTPDEIEEYSKALDEDISNIPF